MVKTLLFAGLALFLSCWGLRAEDAVTEEVNWLRAA